MNKLAFIILVGLGLSLSLVSAFLTLKTQKSSKKIHSIAFNADIHNEKVAVIIIDHGSKRLEANQSLDLVASNYKSYSKKEIVEPAHMELAEPSISTAFRRCVEQGGTFIVCHPYFLAKGKHVSSDIPELVKKAAEEFPSIKYIITEPLGMEAEGITTLISQSITKVMKEDYLS